MRPLIPIMLLLATSCRKHATSASTEPNLGVPTPKTSLRVLTYNVYVYNADLPGTAKLIRSIDADVVALQETTGPIESALRSALSDVYPYMEFHVGPIGNGPGILSKIPWSNGKYSPFVVGLNGYWRGSFSLAGRTFTLIDTHLHPSPIEGWNPLAIKRAYDAGEAIRTAQIEELRAHLPKGQPAMVLGDFNSLTGSATLSDLDSFGLIDGLAGSLAASEPTFRIAGLGFHIDHLHVSPSLAVTAPTVRREGTSDHLPVVATLAWSAPAR